MSGLVVLRACALSITATAVVWLYVCAWRNPSWTPTLASYCRRLDADLVFLRARAMGARVLSLQLIACMSLVLAAFAWDALWLLVGVAATAWWPQHALARARARRVERLEAQLDGWLIALASSLRGTPSLGEALSSTAHWIGAPLSEEIDHVLKETQLGIPLDVALTTASERMGSRTFAATMLTLRIARASGGSISDCLESSAAALREMIRLDGVLRCKTAEGRSQAMIVSVLPLPFFAMLFWLDPKFLEPLITSSRGHCVLLVAVILWLTGALLARRIMQMEL